MVMEADLFVSKFRLSFSWDFEQDWSSKDIYSAIIKIVGEGDARSQDQIVCSSVQDAGIGVLLTQPHPETDVIPCEMHFKAHPQTTDCCITKIVCVSDARNAELFVDDMYEKTAKGYMLTLKRGKKASMFESEFDLSQHVQGNHKITVKFVTGNRTSLKLLCVIIKVIRCNLDFPAVSQFQQRDAETIDMNNVRRMINEIGAKPSNGAEKLMADVELQQRMQALKLQESIEMAQRLQLVNNAVPTDSNEGWKRRSVPPGISSLIQQWTLDSTVDTSLTRQRPVSMPSQKTFGTGNHINEVIRMFLQENAAQQSAVLPMTDTDRSHVIKRTPSKIGLRSSKRLDPISRSDIIGQLSSRPNSESFSDTMERALQSTLKTPSEVNEQHQSSNQNADDAKRCPECGCPGCLNVYDSISTNIYASEQRIMGKVDMKMQELLRHVDSRFDSLYDSLIARQDNFMTTLLGAAAGLPMGTSQRK